MAKKWIQGALGVRTRRLGKGKRHRKAVRKVARHAGALHRMLGVVGPIPRSLLAHAVRAPEDFFASAEAQQKLRRRAQFALTARSFKHRK